MYEQCDYFGVNLHVMGYIRNGPFALIKPEVGISLLPLAFAYAQIVDRSPPL